MLVDMTAVYNDGEKVDVEFSTPDEGSYAAPARNGNDEHVAVVTNVRESLGRSTLSKADQLRVITDTLSHEVEHVRESDLHSKQDISEEYGKDGRIAGTVSNILEDQYIDRTRTERFRGLKKAHAFKIDAIMGNSHRRPKLDTIDDTGTALVEGLTQVAFAGFAKGIADADDDVREFLGWVRPKIDEARHEDDPDTRLDIARDVTDKLLSYIPDEEGREGARQRADEVQGGGSDGVTDDVEFQPDPDAEPADVGDDGSGDDDGPTELDADDLTPEQAQEMLDDAEPGDAGDASDADFEIDADDLQERADDADAETDDESDEEGDADGSSTSDDADESGDDSDEQSGRDTSDAPSPSQATDERDGELPESRVENELDEMERMDEAGESAEWHGLSSAEQYENDLDFERRAEQLEQNIKAEQTDMGQRIKQRDERLDEYDSATSGPADRARQKLRETGLGREIEEAFRALKTRDRDIADKSGPKIHKRNAIRHVAGDHSTERVYERTLRAETGDRSVMVSCDLSGSMDGRALRVALGALYIATREIDDELIISGWHESQGDATQRLVTAPQEEFEWEHLDSIWTEGGTPTAEGVADARQLVKEGTKRERVIIVITDGKPNHGHSAKTRAEREVREARTEGTTVIGMGVGRVDENLMGRIFGEDGYVMAGMDNLADALIDVYSSQMKVGEIQR